MIITLCKLCSDVIKDDDTQIIYRLDREQIVMDRCTICNRKGFDYEVRDKDDKKSFKRT